MRIGEKISKEQEQLLARARRGGPLQFEAFIRLAQDDDIRGNREDLHPDWLEIFAAQRGTIERQLPSDAYRVITSFFEEAQPLDSNLATRKRATLILAPSA